MRADGAHVDALQRRLRTPRIIRHPVHRHVERFSPNPAGLRPGVRPVSKLLDDLRIASRRRFMLDASADVIGIEQMSAGYAKIVGCALGFLVTNIARSSAKPIRVADHRRTRDTDGISPHRGIDSSAAIRSCGHNRHCPWPMCCVRCATVTYDTRPAGDAHRLSECDRRP